MKQARNMDGVGDGPLGKDHRVHRSSDPMGFEWEPGSYHWFSAAVVEAASCRPAGPGAWRRGKP